MPKGRMINKRISKDLELAKLSLPTALLYTWCIPFLDVEGRLEADSVILKGLVVPYRKDFTLKVIEKCLQELAKTPLITYYGNNHKYMEFKGFSKNQTIHKDREAPSEIPPPELMSKSCEGPAKDNISKDNISIRQVANATPTEIYDHYAKTIKAGAKEDAIKNITKLLKTGFTKADLVGRIDAYAKQLRETGKQDKQYYIQANNFFGEKARFKDYEPIKIVVWLPADPNCKACKGTGRLQTGEGQLQRCWCVKEKK